MVSASAPRSSSRRRPAATMAAVEVWAWAGIGSPVGAQP
jgi:hypothetical protein